MENQDKCRILEEVCHAIRVGDKASAAAIVRENYPFVVSSVKPKPAHRSKPTRTLLRDESYPLVKLTGRSKPVPQPKTMRVLLRDGFIDRYSGERLVFPPVLKTISLALPEDFPYHPHWAMDRCHVAYWHQSATIDHVIPLTRGGTDDEENLVCTSMMRNLQKSNWMPKELGWDVFLPGDCRQWDGLVSWFLEYIDSNRALLGDSYLRGWHSTATRAVRDA